MKITFCGAAETTTGSQHLLEINNQRILLDCGLYQGRRQESYERNQKFPFEPSKVDAVVLSHAHIDHSGNLPNLVKQGFRGNIYSTFATRDLCSVMLPDSGRIQENDAEFLNKRRKRDEAEVVPLYDERAAELSLRQFVTVGYERPMLIAEGVTLSFVDAGHLLGSAQVVLDIKEGGKSSRLVFSGDVGRGNSDLLRDPVDVENVDHLIMESTYGGCEHELPMKADARFGQIVLDALKRRGRIIIPAFAVERTQQILFALHKLFEADTIPDVPVFVDSPLAVSATEIFRLHPECFNAEVYDSLFERENPFSFENLTMVRSLKQSKELNHIKEPCIIVAASGMCEAGRVLHHLRYGIADNHNTVLFVGYCAENTLGWRIRQGFDTVRILGDEFRVRAHIEAIDSFSGHADHSELLGYYNRMSGSKKSTWLVHGETTRSAALLAALLEQHSDKRVEVAKRLMEVEL